MANVPIPTLRGEFAGDPAWHRIGPPAVPDPFGRLLQRWPLARNDPFTFLENPLVGRGYRDRDDFAMPSDLRAECSTKIECAGSRPIELGAVFWEPGVRNRQFLNGRRRG
jgi:hypothetical protein